MKKKILFLLLMVVSILNMISVKAETCNPDKISIESISIEEKNDNTEELEEATSEGKNIKLNLSMSDVGDNIKYKLIIKNDSNEDYKLDEKSLNIESDYINYTFETEDKDTMIKANTSKIVYLNVEYKNEIPEETMENDSYNEIKTITIDYIDNEEIKNPETKRNIIILLIVSVLIISTVFIGIKKKKYIKPMILIIGIGFIIPVAVYALCDTNIQIELQLKIVKPCVPFNDENSWPDIIKSVKNNKTECMNVGDTKTVDLGNLGTHTVRIANKSTPSECSQEDFSQTACGFVVEFADVITTHAMNSSSSGSTNGTGNKGGWEHSEMRTYVSTTIYDSLPAELKAGITDTKVISSHGSNDSTNFTTTDKLYLLSAHEVWEGRTYYGDTAYDNTRQLDYYNGLGVTTSNYSGANKQNNGSNSYWYLTTANSDYYTNFINVDKYGSPNRDSSDSTYGVSPAFRIG